jgi:hypothetical protein
MEGTAWLLRGTREKAAEAWQNAVQAGASLDAPIRAASTFPQVAAALVDLLTRLGLRAQADYVSSLLDADEEKVDPGAQLPEVSPTVAVRSNEILATKVPSDLASMESTADLTGMVPANPALPFVPATSSAEAQPVPPRPAAARRDSRVASWAEETQQLLSQSGAARSALPFGEHALAHEPSPARPPGSEAPAGEHAAGLPSWAEETMGLPLASGQLPPALPFGVEPSQAFLEALHSGQDPEGPSWAGETITLSFKPGEARSVLPFGEPSSPPTVAPERGEVSPGPFAGGAADVILGLNVQQYASLCAALAVFPDKTSVLLPRFGIHDEEECKRLNEAWGQHFLRDPALRQAWIDLYAQYRDRLVQQKR